MGRVLNEYSCSIFTLEKENIDMEFRKRDCEELAQFDIGNGEAGAVYEHSWHGHLICQGLGGKRWQVHAHVDHFGIWTYGGAKSVGYLGSIIMKGILMFVASLIWQRDLWVQVQDSLKFAPHVDRVVKKVFGTLAFIAQTFKYKSWDIMLRVYKML
eukprot:g47303.t1